MAPKKDKATTALMVKGQDVPSVLQILEEKISSLKHITDTVYKTTGNLEGFGTNIQKEMKVENLIRAFGSVMARSEVYNAAAKALGQKTYPAFEVSGGDMEAWKHDIILRINIINHQETLDKLNGYKEKMSKFLSEEDQKSMLLKEMAEFMSVGQ
jgi:hypothetical protein